MKKRQCGGAGRALDKGHDRDEENTPSHIQSIHSPYGRQCCTDLGSFLRIRCRRNGGRFGHIFHSKRCVVGQGVDLTRATVATKRILPASTSSTSGSLGLSNLIPTHSARYSWNSCFRRRPGCRPARPRRATRSRPGVEPGRLVGCLYVSRVAIHTLPASTSSTSGSLGLCNLIGFRV